MEISVFLGCWRKGLGGNAVEITYNQASECSENASVYIATIMISAPLQKPRKISRISVSVAGRRDRAFEGLVRKAALTKTEERFGIELVQRSGGKLVLAKKMTFEEISDAEMRNAFEKWALEYKKSKPAFEEHAKKDAKHASVVHERVRKEPTKETAPEKPEGVDY